MSTARRSPFGRFPLSFSPETTTQPKYRARLSVYAEGSLSDGRRRAPEAVRQAVSAPSRGGLYCGERTGPVQRVLPRADGEVYALADSSHPPYFSPFFDSRSFRSISAGRRRSVSVCLCGEHGIWLEEIAPSSPPSLPPSTSPGLHFAAITPSASELYPCLFRV